jgi:hypothetical protein
MSLTLGVSKDENAVGKLASRQSVSVSVSATLKTSGPPFRRYVLGA